ncbi:MAG: DinB family protein [Flavobacteriaceae bacterium]|nr:MAG: DinB family protein [Flavobacteriaceae bacterium]
MKYTPKDYFPYYIEKAGSQDILSLLEEKAYLKILGNLSEEQANFRYEKDKWSIKQVLGHITDHERIMTYRALRFSRKDKTVLPGYDENFFVDNARFDELSLSDLLLDLDNVRNASLSLVKSLSKEQLLLKGSAWKFELTVEEFIRAFIGHEMHHLEILSQRYLPLL